VNRGTILFSAKNPLAFANPKTSFSSFNSKSSPETPNPITLPEKQAIFQNLESAAVGQSSGILLIVRSMRIFDLFPDKLIIDEHKVSFIYKGAFGVKSIHSVLIENITYVEAHTSFMTGCLVIIDSSNFLHPIELKIENLRKDAANRARKLIQGLLHAKNLKMDNSKLSLYVMENNMEKLGEVGGED
jgi:hypothetical protein